MTIPGWPGGAPYHPAPPPARNNHTLRIVLIVVGSLVALCCCGGIAGGVYLFHSYQKESGPAGDVTDRFVTDLENGDSADAYGLLCDDVQGALSSEQFARGVDAQPRIVGHKSEAVKVTTGTGGTRAVVTMRLTLQSGFVDRHDFPLVKQDGSWKVCGRPY